MKTYRGIPGSERVVVRDSEDAPDRPLTHVILHSPSGMLWGYEGSGPADLALSLLADALEEDPSRWELYTGKCKCWELHQRFKREFVAHWPTHMAWSVSQEDILLWIETGEVHYVVGVR